jgi:hypothetical protein
MQRLAAVVWLSFLLSPRADAQTAPPKFEAGAQFTTIHLTDVKENTFGFGIRFVYNPVRYLSLESEVNYTVTRPPFATSLTGGHVLEGFFGPKAGLRKSKFGVFGKIRPGFASFSDVVKSVDPSTFTVQTGRRTQFALDVGGVVEIYASRRVSLRYDMGDTIVFYGRQVIFPPPFPEFPGLAQHNFQFSSGILFRF